MTISNPFETFANQLKELILAGAQLEGTECPFQNQLTEDHLFGQKALELFQAQWTHNAAYRKFCDYRQVTPATPIHWSAIPALPASAFKTQEVTSLKSAERSTVFHSSGTTEQPRSRHYHHRPSLELYQASVAVWFQRHFFGGASARPPRIQMVLLTPPIEKAPHSSLVHMLETLRVQFGATASTYCGQLDSSGAWTLDFSRLRATLSEAVAGQVPVAVLGTAFSFVHWLDWLARHPPAIALPPGSWIMETGGYKGRSRTLPKAQLHALISEHLSLPKGQIVTEYGMSELSSQAYDHRLNSNKAATLQRRFHFPPWARAQLISPETGQSVGDGETGLLRIYDLTNVWSVMALQTADLGIRRGTGFELIGRAAQSEPRGCSLMAAS